MNLSEEAEVEKLTELTNHSCNAGITSSGVFSVCFWGQRGRDHI